MRIGTGIAISNPMSSAGGAPDQSSLIFTIEIISANEVFRIVPGAGVDAVIDWGDGSQSAATDPASYDLFHIYDAPGTYTVSVEGTMPSFGFGAYGGKVRTVVRLGDLGYTNLSSAFSGCVKMTSFTAAPCNTSGVTSFSSFFNACTKLSSVDLTGIDSSAATTMTGFFFGCRSLTSVDISPLSFASATSVDSLFQNCTSLTSVDLSGVEMPVCTTLASAFNNCAQLTTANLSGLSAPLVTSTASMFANCLDMVAVNMTGVSMPALTTIADMFTYCGSLTSGTLAFASGGLVTTTSGAFRHCRSLTSVSTSGFNTSSLTNASSMFFGCRLLASVDVSAFNMASVTNMSSMFASCTSLSDPAISGWNVANVTNADGFASGVTFSTANYDAILQAWSVQALKSNVAIDFGSAIYTAYSAADTARMDMNRLYNWRFADRGSTLAYGSDLVFTVLTTSAGQTVTFSLPAGTYNATIDWGDGTTGTITSNTDPDRARTYVNPGSYIVRISGVLPGLSTFPSAVREVRQVGNTGLTSFGPVNSACYAFHAKTCNVSGFALTSAFWGSAASAQLVCANLDGFNPSVSTMANMFTSRTEIQSLRLGSFAAQMSAATSFSNAFSNLFKCRTLDISGLSTASATTLANMFNASSQICELNLSSFSSASITPTGATGIFGGCNSLQSVSLSWLNVSGITSFVNLLNACQSLRSVDVSALNTSSCSNFSNIFNGCTILTSIDISNFNLSSATLLSGLFNNCPRIRSISFPSLSVTGLVTSMSSLFSGCNDLRSVNVSSLNTTSCTDMSSMFFNCSMLEEIDVSGFNTAACSNMSSMFSNCRIANPNVSGFNTSSCTNLTSMFASCSYAVPNISGFNTSLVTSMNGMFNNCPGVCDLNIAALEINAITGTGLSNFAASVLINTSKYDAALIAFDAATPKNNGVTAGFGFSRYTPGGAAEAARANLVSTNLWVITDGGAVT